MNQTQLCPCGTEKQLTQCCLPLIQGKSKANSAEELLRSRYTAFTRGDVDYILDTHHSKTRDQVTREEITDWSKNSKWIKMEILQKEAGQPTDTQGTVTFHVQYEADGKVTDHWEHSLFEKENGEWRFLDAQALKPGPLRRTEPKVGRNDPCACGSGKKSKKCCAA